MHQMAHMGGFEGPILFVVTVQLLQPSMFRSVKTTVFIYFIPLIRLSLLLSHLVHLLLIFLLLFLLLLPLPLLLFRNFLLPNLLFFFACVALILSPIVTLFMLNLNLDLYLFCRCDRRSLN